MKNLKKRGLVGMGRRFVFTLALFLLVFAVASAVKIQAAGNVTGWLWGGGTESDGSEPWDATQSTNVRWISFSNEDLDPDTLIPYSVNIPANDGEAVTGYAWSGGDDSGPGLGWIDFNPQDHCVTDTDSVIDTSLYSSGEYEADSCAVPAGSGCTAGVFLSGDLLTGCARIVGIAEQSVIGNSGGWEGWIKMSGTGATAGLYGVDLKKMNGDESYPKSLSEMTFATAGKDELGWIDFSRAKAPCTPLPGGCGSATSQTYCAVDDLPTANLCNSVSEIFGSNPTGEAPWSWQCVSNVCPGEPTECHTADYSEPDNGACGTAASENFCGKSAPDSNLCTNGTTSSVSTGYFKYTWTCGSTTCGGTPVSCSAPGNHCGWIETNP